MMKRMKKMMIILLAGKKKKCWEVGDSSSSDDRSITSSLYVFVLFVWELVATLATLLLTFLFLSLDNSKCASITTSVATIATLLIFLFLCLVNSSCTSITGKLKKTTKFISTFSKRHFQEIIIKLQI